MVRTLLLLAATTRPPLLSPSARGCVRARQRARSRPRALAPMRAQAGGTGTTAPPHRPHTSWRHRDAVARGSDLTSPTVPRRPASTCVDRDPCRSPDIPGGPRQPRRSGSEITEILRRDRDARRDEPPARRPRTHRPSYRTSDLRAPHWTVLPTRHGPEDLSSPSPRAVHKVAHRGASFCGYHPRPCARVAGHGRERHSYTACGWSCPQSSTGLLWVFTSAECRRRRRTTTPRCSRQTVTTSWFSPRNLWMEALVHSLWTAHPDPVCAQFCGQLWMKALAVWTGTLDRWTTCGDRSSAHKGCDFPTLSAPVRPHAFVASDLRRHRFSTRSTTPMTTTKVFSEGKFHTPSSGSGGRRCDLCSASLLPILTDRRQEHDVVGDRRPASIPRPTVPVPPTRLLA